jgi:hypothetical protein
MLGMLDAVFKPPHFGANPVLEVIEAVIES